ncbi:MAG: hypothetical protein SPC78_08180, partial [Candidatus Faecousia sp.]|nr:hypothetical protein [Candidatus Faecousia sp.]
MGKKFRLTALTLAVSLLLNMVPLPVNAEEDSANTGAEAAEEALVAQLSDDEQLVGSSGDTILEGDDATSKDNLDTDNADTDNADTDNADTDNADTDNADTDNADTDNADTDNADTD